MKDKIKLNSKKIAAIIIVMFMLITGYTFGTNSPYILIDCSLGNDIKIYLTTTSADNRLVYNEAEKLILNVSGSTVYGYMERNNEQFQIYFPTYDTPYYRTSNNYTYVYITNVTNIRKHGVSFYKTFDDSTILFGCVAALLFMILLKKG